MDRIAKNDSLCVVGVDSHGAVDDGFGFDVAPAQFPQDARFGHDDTRHLVVLLCDRHFLGLVDHL